MLREKRQRNASARTERIDKDTRRHRPRPVRQRLAPEWGSEPPGVFPRTQLTLGRTADPRSGLRTPKPNAQSPRKHNGLGRMPVPRRVASGRPCPKLWDQRAGTEVLHQAQVWAPAPRLDYAPAHGASPGSASAGRAGEEGYVCPWLQTIIPPLPGIQAFPRPASTGFCRPPEAHTSKIDNKMSHPDNNCRNW